LERPSRTTTRAARRAVRIGALRVCDIRLTRARVSDGGNVPPDRRRRRFRRPGTGRWLTESLPSLRLELVSTVRATLTAWMRLYGEANNVRGLATGPIETRFARLLQNTEADNLIVWTTPTRWAAGEGLSLRFPQLHLRGAAPDWLPPEAGRGQRSLAVGLAAPEPGQLIH